MKEFQLSVSRCSGQSVVFCVVCSFYQVINFLGHQANQAAQDLTFLLPVSPFCHCYVLDLSPFLFITLGLSHVQSVNTFRVRHHPLNVFSNNLCTIKIYQHKALFIPLVVGNNKKIKIDVSCLLGHSTQETALYIYLSIHMSHTFHYRILNNRLLGWMEKDVNGVV